MKINKGCINCEHRYVSSDTYPCIKCLGEDTPIHSHWEPTAEWNKWMEGIRKIRDGYEKDQAKGLNQVHKAIRKIVNELAEDKIDPRYAAGKIKQVLNIIKEEF